MSRYILLTNWTEQGIKNVKDSPHRLDAAKALANKLGGDLRKFYLTTGSHDMVQIVELPDDEAAAKYVLTLGMGGNVRTTTLKAFPEEAYREIIGSLSRFGKLAIDRAFHRSAFAVLGGRGWKARRA